MEMRMDKQCEGRRRHVVGIDVGGTKTAYGLYDAGGRLLAKHRHATDAEGGGEELFGRMAAEVEELLARQGLGMEDVRGVGVGMPSFVRFDEGVVVATAFLKNVRNFAARGWLQARLGDGIRVVIDNDAHAAALAEHRHGAGRGFRHMLYCPVSTGMASGMIIDNQLFRGSYGWSGESGHMVATPGEGEWCGCGNQGCYASYCSGAMIVRHVERWIRGGAASCLAEPVEAGIPLTAEHVLAAYRRGDAVAIRAVEQMGRYLGLWCFNLYLTLNINCYVFGGGLTNFGEDLFGRVRAVFDAYNRNDYPVYFKMAELGEEAGLIGARELVVQEEGGAGPVA